MRLLFFILYATLASWLSAAHADDGDAFDYALQFSIERSAADGITLGDDPTEDRQADEEFEFEFALEYQVNESFYLFFVGAPIDETETIETVGREEDASGLERKEIGAGYFFGEEIPTQLRFGRSEFAAPASGGCGGTKNWIRFDSIRVLGISRRPWGWRRNSRVNRLPTISSIPSSTRLNGFC